MVNRWHTRTKKIEERFSDLYLLLFARNHKSDPFSSSGYITGDIIHFPSIAGAGDGCRDLFKHLPQVIAVGFLPFSKFSHGKYMEKQRDERLMG